MADISTWSPIDESNTAAPPAGAPENMPTNTVNNTMRAMMGAIRRWYDTVATQLANYLPLTGGTLTGDLNVPFIRSFGDAHVNGTLYSTYVETTFAHSSGNVAADGQLGAPLVQSYKYNLRGYAFAEMDAAAAYTKIGDPAGSNLTMYAAGDNYYDNDTHNFRSRGGSAYAIFSGGGTFNVNGSWGVISDEAAKTDIAGYTRGLAAVQALAPVQFRYGSGPFAGDAVRYGLIAQDMQTIVPEMVGETQLGDERFLTMQPGMLVWLLVNSCKELAERIEELEQRVPNKG